MFLNVFLHLEREWGEGLLKEAETEKEISNKKK